MCFAWKSFFISCDEHSNLQNSYKLCIHIDSFNTFSNGIGTELLNSKMKNENRIHKIIHLIMVQQSNKNISELIELCVVFDVLVSKLKTLLFHWLLVYSLSFICVCTGFVIANSKQHNWVKFELNRP